VAAEPVLGVPQVQPSLLDDVSNAAGRSACRRHTACRRRHGSRRAGSRQAGRRRVVALRESGYSMDFLLDDEDDEVIDDEDFDEDSEDEDSDEDSDEDDEEEEETWQVSTTLTS